MGIINYKVSRKAQEGLIVGLVVLSLTSFIIEAVILGFIPIFTIAYGAVYSMAGVLFVSGTKGCRLMLPHSRLMLHPASYTGTSGGSLRDMRAKSEMLQEYEDITNKILSKHSGQKIEKIIKDNSYDHIYSVEDAIKNGFCDRILTLEDYLEGGN